MRILKPKVQEVINANPWINDLTNEINEKEKHLSREELREEIEKLSEKFKGKHISLWLSFLDSLSTTCKLPRLSKVHQNLFEDRSQEIEAAKWIANSFLSEEEILGVLQTKLKKHRGE